MEDNMDNTILKYRAKAITQEVETVAILSSIIAHEIKNYLAAIHICDKSFEIKVKEIKNRVKTASYLIGNLQLQIKRVITGKPDKKDFKQYSIAKDITEALEQYTFKDKELELITLGIDKGFKHLGNSILTKHILYNLIRNALRAIENAGKGEITIKFKSEIDSSKLIFRDTVMGIAKKFLPKIFTLFESQAIKQEGTGVGLAFCKLIMQSYGGDVSFNSVTGEYTEFVLSFPLIE
jgi:signal transduction histidine kinase